MNQLFKTTHLSGSTINSFIERRYGFYKSKVLRAPFKTNPNMCRGKAVEEMVNRWIEGRGIYSTNEEFSEKCLEYYDSELLPYVAVTPGYKKEADKCRLSVADLAALAYNTYKEKFEFTKPWTQQKIYTKYDDVDIELVGVLDYYIPNNIVRDCKAVSQSAKKLSQGYCIAGAIYKKATGCPVIYDLFVANKNPVHCELKMTEDEYKFGLSYGAAAAKVMIELNTCEDPARAFELSCFPNLDEMYDPIEKRETAEAWNIWIPEEKTEE